MSALAALGGYAIVLLSVAFALASLAFCVKVERGTRRAKKELETLIKNNNNE